MIDNSLYLDVENFVNPILTKAANKFCNQLGISREDALQDAKIELVNILDKYDYNNSHGGIYDFVWVSLRNYFIKRLCKKKFETYYYVVDDIIDNIGTNVVYPDTCFLDLDYNEIELLKNEIYKRLDKRSQEILFCKIDTPYDLRQIMIDNCQSTVRVKLICEYLGVDKNVVDYSMRKIRRVAINVIDSKFNYLSNCSSIKNYKKRIGINE